MAYEWISLQKDLFFIDNISLLGPEQLASTTRKIMDLNSSKNVSQVMTAVQKSIKSTQNASSWIDSGT